VTCRRAFAGRLGRRMASVGLSQADVARQLAVTRTAVHLWRRGAAEPRPERLDQLALLLGVRAEWLATGAGPEAPGPADATRALVRARAEVDAARRALYRAEQRLAAVASRRAA
jgi:transcriptional regulator with XRE-family HTH domain